MLPIHTIHEIFANHQDTEAGFCEKYHSHLGTHIEKTHTHCEILKTNAQVYNSPVFPFFNKVELSFFTIIKTGYKSIYINNYYNSVSARGPPELA